MYHCCLTLMLRCCTFQGGEFCVTMCHCRWVKFHLGFWLMNSLEGCCFFRWNYVFLPKRKTVDVTEESDFESESPQNSAPWLAEDSVPVCHSFLSRWMVRSCGPMGGQRWGCNSDPGKNSPLFLGPRRSATSLLPALPAQSTGAHTTHWQVRPFSGTTDLFIISKLHELLLQYYNFAIHNLTCWNHIAPYVPLGVTITL